MQILYFRVFLKIFLNQNTCLHFLQIINNKDNKVIVPPPTPHPTKWVLAMQKQQHKKKTLMMGFTSFTTFKMGLWWDQRSDHHLCALCAILYGLGHVWYPMPQILLPTQNCHHVLILLSWVFFVLKKKVGGVEGSIYIII